MRKIPQARVEQKSIPFKGGLDVVTPAMYVDRGKVVESQNYYQDIDGGYATLEGYERYTGESAPSAAPYSILTTQNMVADVGDVVTNVAGDASGTIIAMTSEYIVMAGVVGSFEGELIMTGSLVMSAGLVMAGTRILMSGGISVGTYTGTPTINGGSTPALRAEYANLAADHVRADLDPPAGSGDLLGTWYYDGDQYAFRNNTAGTATVMFKASSSGWTEISALGTKLSFTSGSIEPVLEQTITGATSGATATIKRIIPDLDTATWGAGNVPGYLILADIADGPFETGEELSTATSTFVADGDSVEITIPVPSGRFEFINETFTGSYDDYRMYGCDGKNPAFEFDGSVFVPIETGMVVDAPEHIWIHKSHLFLSFSGSVQNSSPGLPYLWSVVVGAGEQGMGDTVSGFASQPGASGAAAMTVFSKNRTSTMYGSSVDTFELIPYKNEVGAIPYSIQQIGNTFFLSDRGIAKLTTTQSYGNFADATASQPVQPWLKTKRPQVTASCVSREKNQYWIFFADKTALCCTVDNGEIVAIMPILLSHKVTCVSSQEDENGNEIIFFGSADGHVRQLNKGTSFDGEKIEAYLDIHYYNCGSPFTEKGWMLAMLEASGTGYCECKFSYSLEYGSEDVAQPVTQTKDISLIVPVWDTFTWEAFTWDGAKLSPSYFPLDGESTNISLKFRSNSANFSSVRYSGAILQFTPLGDIR